MSLKSPENVVNFSQDKQALTVNCQEDVGHMTNVVMTIMTLNE